MGGILLGDNQYGKAETHVVRLTRSGAKDDIKDLTVSVALAASWMLRGTGLAVYSLLLSAGVLAS